MRFSPKFIIRSRAANDGFRGLSALLFGAGGRYCSVRVSVRHRRRGDLATGSINRYEEYGFRRGILHNLDPPYHEPRYSQYGDLNEFSRLFWHERPDRWRQETDLSDGSDTAYRVADGGGP